MKLHFSPFTAPVAIFALSFVAGCGDAEDPPGNTAGATSTGGAPTTGGVGGASAGSGGLKSTAGATFGGTAGQGVGGATAGSPGSAGKGGGMSGGTAGQTTGGGGTSGGATGGSPSGGGGATAGSSSGGSGGGIPATWETVKFVFDQGGCYGTICHDLHENNLYMKGTDDERYMELMNTKSKHCGSDFSVVIPNNPGKSSLPKILREGCGSLGRMPDKCVTGTEIDCIQEEYIQAIETWIANGAKR